MAATAYSRGWLLWWDGKLWRYADSKEPLTNRRPCSRCGERPTPEGHDACLGTLPDVTSACCGHGLEATAIGPHIVDGYELHTTGGSF